jgi:gamma-glutamyltranspeptidase
VQLFADERDWLAQFPSTKVVFLHDGRPLREGQILRQPDLERTLRAISERGVDGFYRGSVARALVLRPKAPVARKAGVPSLSLGLKLVEDGLSRSATVMRKARRETSSR